jgi:phage terminase small subunit
MSQDNLPEKISPEGVEVANRYLESSCSIQDTANSLSMEKHEVSELLNNPHVKKYVDSVLMEAGFRQMDKLEEVINVIIEDKLEELKEAEVTSSKDIVEILSVANKLAIDRVKMIVERNKEAGKVVNQRNTQLNVYDSASNYGKLMEAIATGKPI